MRFLLSMRPLQLCLLSYLPPPAYVDGFLALPPADRKRRALRGPSSSRPPGKACALSATSPTLGQLKQSDVIEAEADVLLRSSKTMADADRRDAEQTTWRRKEVGLLFNNSRSNYWLRVPPVTLQANHRDSKKSRRAMAAHNETSGKTFGALNCAGRGLGDDSAPAS